VSDHLRDLYQEVILDHSKAPRNFHALTGATFDAEGFNPLCGDEVHVWLALEGDSVRDISFTGNGCAISKASASMMTQAVKGKTKAETEALFGAFHRLVTGEGDDPERLGKLAVFGGVSEYPVRVKCASLAWHTLKAALEGAKTPVSTE
jgi:nitrogen fixation NifU-like protein